MQTRIPHAPLRLASTLVLLLGAVPVQAQVSLVGNNGSGGVVVNLPDVSAAAAELEVGRAAARLRCVSLTRVLKRLGEHDSLATCPPPLRRLAELGAIEYVLLYPELNEIVLAGPPLPPTQRQAPPARPEFLSLDLLLAALAHTADGVSGVVRCSIDPDSGTGPDGARLPRTLEARQRVTVTGVDPSSPLAHVCVIADIRLKQLALGAAHSGSPQVPELLRVLPARANGAARIWLESAFQPAIHSPCGHVWQLTAPRVTGHARAVDQRKQDHGAAGSVQAEQRWADRLIENYPVVARHHPAFAELVRLMNFCQVAVTIHQQAHVEPLGDVEAGHLRHLAHWAPPVPEQLGTLVRDGMVGRRRVRISGGISIELALAAATSEADLDVHDMLGAARPPTDRETWWWDIASGREGTGAELSTFYGVPLGGERILLLLDKSLSMCQASRAGGSRWQRAVSEVHRALLGGAHGHVDVAVFDAAPRLLRCADQTADAASAAQVLELLARIHLSGNTNLGAALAAGLTREPPYDAIYVLSDGALNAGRLQEPRQLLAAVEQWNASRGTRLVTFGIGPDWQGERLLRQLAALTGGEYRRVE